MTRNGRMKWNKSFSAYCLRVACSLGLLVSTLVVRAQDAVPSLLEPDSVIPDCDTLFLYSHRTDTVALPLLCLPETFQNVSDNQLTDSLGVLHPVWERLRMLKLAAGAGQVSDSLNIVHVGDSHVRGHIFPRTAGEVLKQAFGAVRYTDFGINGAFCFTFLRQDRIDRIADLHPDFLILSLGTNESHNRRYNSTLHYRQMEELVRELRARLPNVPILVTTPPGSYERQRTNRRRRSYVINPRTSTTVKTIERCADANGLAYWDMYNLLGGAKRACLNWQEAGLMRPDHIHFMPEGYKLQGELLGQALLKAYNNYVKSQ